MTENKSSTDFDDSEVLTKFRNLLSKYQNQGKPISASNNTAALHATAASDTDAILQTAESDKIPVLTEVVILHPSVIQPQPKRLASISQVLAGALEDANIEMNSVDREALAQTLEARLAVQVNNRI